MISLGSYPHARISERYRLPYWVVVTLAEGCRSLEYAASARNDQALAALADHTAPLSAATQQSVIASLFADIWDAAQSNPWRAPHAPARPGYGTTLP